MRASRTVLSKWSVAKYTAVVVPLARVFFYTLQNMICHFPPHMPAICSVKWPSQYDEQGNKQSLKNMMTLYINAAPMVGSVFYMSQRHYKILSFLPDNYHLLLPIENVGSQSCRLR